MLFILRSISTSLKSQSHNHARPALFQVWMWTREERQTSGSKILTNLILIPATVTFQQSNTSYPWHQWLILRDPEGRDWCLHQCLLTPVTHLKEIQMKYIGVYTIVSWHHKRSTGKRLVSTPVSCDTSGSSWEIQRKDISVYISVSWHHKRSTGKRLVSTPVSCDTSGSS